MKLTHVRMVEARKIVARVEKKFEDDEGYMGVDVEFQDTGIWFHEDEYINIQHLEYLVGELLDGLKIDEPFCFSWAYTCSKPVIDAYGGGACVVKRGYPSYWVDAMSAVQGHKFKDKK